jgi:Zn-dependent protease
MTLRIFPISNIRQSLHSSRGVEKPIEIGPVSHFGLIIAIARRIVVAMLDLVVVFAFYNWVLFIFNNISVPVLSCSSAFPLS